MFYSIKHFFDRGTWKRERVAKAVELGRITADEYAEICGGPYPPNDNDAADTVAS